MPANWKAWTIATLGAIAVAYVLLDFGFKLGKKAGYTNYEVNYGQWLVKETERLDQLITDGDPKEIQIQATRLSNLTKALGNKERFYRILTWAEQGDDAN